MNELTDYLQIIGINDLSIDFITHILYKYQYNNDLEEVSSSEWEVIQKLIYDSGVKSSEGKYSK